MVPPSRRRQGLEEIAIDQAPKITADSEGERAVTELDVSVQGSLGEVRRGHEHHLVVGYDGLRMQNAVRASDGLALDGPGLP
jgi:hypothetical protein